MVDANEVLDCILPDKLKHAVEQIAQCQDDSFKEARKEHPGANVELIAQFARCDSTDMAKIMRNAGAKYIHRGAYRDVWGWDDCIVKVPNSVRSRVDNLIEADIWKYGPDKLKQYLAPVDDTDAGATYVTMPEADTDIGHIKLIGISLMLGDDLKKVGYACADVTPQNVGLLNGKPVLFDYGSDLTDCSLNTLVTETRELEQRKSASLNI